MMWLGGEDINLKMEAEGMAWCYHYSKNERKCRHLARAIRAAHKRAFFVRTPIPRRQIDR